MKVGISTSQVGMDMRQFAFALMALVSVGSAHAADLTVKGPPRPVLAPLPTWTGCYVGANVGGAFAQTDFTQVGKVDGTPATGNFGSQSPGSVTGGGQVGCDYQLGNWVIGAQGLIDAAGLDGSNVITAFPAFTIHNKNKWLATATGRLGYTVMPSLLLYGKGGAAFIRDELTVLGTGFTSETAAASRTGWTAGGGLEWMFLPHFSVFVEYAHMDFGTKNIPFTAAPGTDPKTPADVIATRQTVDSVMGGVNYRF